MSTLRLSHSLALGVILLAACDRPNHAPASAETCIAEYIAAVHNADIATMRRLTTSASQMPDAMTDEDLRLAQRIVPESFVPTNTVMGSTNANIDGAATYRNRWITNEWAHFHLILEDKQWKYESHLIDVDEGIDPMSE